MVVSSGGFLIYPRPIADILQGVRFARVSEAKTTAVVGPRLLLISPTQASKVIEGGRGNCQMVVTPRSPPFIDWFFLFLRTTATLRIRYQGMEVSRVC